MCVHTQSRLKLMKLQPSLGAFYTILPANELGLFYSSGACTEQKIQYISLKKPTTMTESQAWASISTVVLYHCWGKAR